MKTSRQILSLLVLLAGSPATLWAREPLHNTIEFWGGVAGWSGDNARSFDTGGATEGRGQERVAVEFVAHRRGRFDSGVR